MPDFVTVLALFVAFAAIMVGFLGRKAGRRSDASPVSADAETDATPYYIISSVGADSGGHSGGHGGVDCGGSGMDAGGSCGGHH